MLVKMVLVEMRQLARLVRTLASSGYGRTCQDGIDRRKLIQRKRRVGLSLSRDAWTEVHMVT